LSKSMPHWAMPHARARGGDHSRAQARAAAAAAGARARVEGAPWSQDTLTP
jgi:hypothetical protein